MSGKQNNPGISRDDRISDEGLARLERQLEGRSQISDLVLSQWIKRYGDSAREIIRRYGRYKATLEI